MLTDAAGAVTSRHDYSAFGSRTSTGAETPVFGFAGQYTDGQTGLIYMRARWYDPQAGQFITSDPIGHASGETNLYRYSGNDRINRVDALGLWPKPPSFDDVMTGLHDASAMVGTIAGTCALNVDNGGLRTRRGRSWSGSIRYGRGGADSYRAARLELWAWISSPWVRLGHR